MSSDFEIERRCSFEKKPGIIQLSPTHLVWTPDSAADGKDVRVAFTSIRQFQVSREGSAKKAMIRLTCNDREAKITFDFGKAFTDRDAIRDVLNKLQAKGANALSATRSPSPAAEPSNNNNNNNNNNSNNNNSNNNSMAPKRDPPKPVSAEERARRQKLLARKEVRKLHAKLVMGGAVTDEQFWNGMKFRYKPNGEKRALRSGAGDLDDDEEAVQQKVRGVPSDAFTSGTDCAAGTGVWEGTVPGAAQRHMVFMEYPAVAKALADKVPREMSEDKFWTIFLQSSMGGKGRGIRTSKLETARAAEADAVFAPYQARILEDERIETEKRMKGMSRRLDLDRADDHRGAHVLDGHATGGEAPRMKKGGRDGFASENLKLMRMVNRHGALIVDEGEGGNWVEEGPRGKPLEDLEVESEPAFAKLDVGGASGGTSGGTGGGTRTEGGGKRRKVEGMWEEMSGWELDVGRMEDAVLGSAAVLESLLASMKP